MHLVTVYTKTTKHADSPPVNRDHNPRLKKSNYAFNPLEYTIFVDYLQTQLDFNLSSDGD